MNLVARMAGNSDRARFGSMPELPMTPARAVDHPSVAVEQFQEFPDFHCSRLLQILKFRDFALTITGFAKRRLDSSPGHALLEYSLQTA